MNDTPHVYHIIDENRMEVFIPDVHQHIEISSVGTQDSDPIEDDRSQLEEPEYLHPYHSLISVIDAERHDYEQTAANVDDAIFMHETYFQRKKSIDTQINQLEWNKMFSQGDCTNEDLRNKAKDKTFSRTTFSDNEIGQSEPNVEPISVNNNITIVKPDLNLVCDNISLD
ncbi:unnamed protein product [Mytilus coruscus]|uniref:Uncharacterized protein n=1 Tax=Mytilus coruscus TaxID=42192 RepID=A0A6J8D6W0_MYTCO|nr:unnamed protein product [Mytilus coruscus]